MAGDVRCVRHPRARPLAVDLDRRDPRGELRFEPIAHRANPRLVFGVAAGGQVHRRGQGDDRRHVLRARAAARLLVAADQQRADRHAAANEQGAHPLGRVQLVARKRQHVDVLHVDRQVDRQLAHRLGRVGVEDDVRVGLLGDPGELFDREDHARLVVRVHDRDEQRIAAQRADKISHVEIPLAIDRQEGHVVAAALEVFADLEDRRVLDRRGDHVAPIGVRLGRAPDGHVVAFGGAGREDDFVGADSAEVLGDPRPGPRHGVGRLLGGRVHRAGVEILLGEKRDHRPVDFRGDLGRGIVVDVDCLHRFFSLRNERSGRLTCTILGAAVLFPARRSRFGHSDLIMRGFVRQRSPSGARSTRASRGLFAGAIGARLASWYTRRSLMPIFPRRRRRAGPSGRSVVFAVFDPLGDQATVSARFPVAGAGRLATKADGGIEAGFANRRPDGFFAGPYVSLSRSCKPPGVWCTTCKPARLGSPR